MSPSKSGHGQANARLASKGITSFLDALRRSRSRHETVDTSKGIRIYAVGDIHGCADLLNRLMASIFEDSKDASGPCTLICLGDYIDRGPDSKGVIDRLIAPTSGFSVNCLRGNHDQMLLDFLAEPSGYPYWRDYGCRETLLSYGVVPPRFEKDSEFSNLRDRLLEALPRAHFEFLSQLPLSFEIGQYFFAHAGVRPGIALEAQAATDLLGIRDEFLTCSAEFSKIIVHGHTPTERPMHRFNRIGVDTGAYATGRLTAAVLEGDKCRFLNT